MVQRARLGGSGVEWGVAKRTFLLRRASLFSVESTPALRRRLSFPWNRRASLFVNSVRARPLLGGVPLSGFVATLPSPNPSFNIPAFPLKGAGRGSDFLSPSGLRSEVRPLPLGASWPRGRQGASLPRILTAAPTHATSGGDSSGSQLRHLRAEGSYRPRRSPFSGEGAFNRSAP